MKTTGQLLPDCFRFTTFDAGCRLKMAFGVKREWKKRNDGDKDYPGDPVTAHMHETHNVTQNRRQLRILTCSDGIKGLQRPNSRPVRNRFVSWLGYWFAALTDPAI
jgi:hypothetical protein